MNKSLKSFFSVLLTIAMMCSLAVLPAHAVDEPKITISAKNPTWNGNTCEVQIVAECTPDKFDFVAGQLDVIFDNTQLTLDSVTGGEFPDSTEETSLTMTRLRPTAISNANESGKATLVFADTDMLNHAISSGQVFATCKFIVKDGIEAGTSTLFKIQNIVLNYQPATGDAIKYTDTTAGTDLSVIIPGATTSVKITGVDLTSNRIAAGGTATATAKAGNTNVSNDNVTWSVTPANQGVTVIDGAITAAANATAGDYTITATGKGTATGTASATLEVTPASVTPVPTTIEFADGSVAIPGTATLTATVKDQTGAVISPAPAVTFAIEGTAPAGVSIDGTTLKVEEAAAAGTITIRATCGNATQTATWTLTKTTPSKAPATIEVAGGDATIAVPTKAVGTAKTKAFTFTVKDQNGEIMTGEEVTWSIPETKGVSIDPNTGVVTVTNEADAGKVTVTATSKKVATVTGTAELEITKAASEAKELVIQRDNRIVTTDTLVKPVTGTNTYEYKVVLTDQYGASMPVTDAKGEFETALTGVTLNTTATTGIATVTVSSTATTGTAKLTATAGGKAATVTLTIQDATVPNAPTGVTATASGTAITVRWTPPANNGGEAITGYKVALDSGTPQTVAANTTTYKFNNVSYGTHTITVVAVNAKGDSDKATSNSVTVSRPADNNNNSGSSSNGTSGTSSPAPKPLPDRNQGTTTPANPTTPSNPDDNNPSQFFFTDVPSNYWAAGSIYWAYENELMRGTSETTFSPENTTTRQQLWMILARLNGANPASMAEARTWAMNNNISDGTNPASSMSRQQMVTFLYRYAQQKGYQLTGSADLSSYSDNSAVSSYAREALSWAVANGIMNGTSQTTLSPTGTATRAQFATILSRFYNSVVSK